MTEFQLSRNPFAMRVVIPVFEGVEELDAIGPLEVFGVASRAGCDMTVRLCAPGAPARLRCFHGVELGNISELDSCADLIVVPGGGWLSGAVGGVRGAIAEGAIPRWLASEHARGATIAGVCTGAFLLQSAGLLNSRPATTHHLAMDDLRGLGVDVSDARVVDAGSVLTAGGIASGLDLALWIVERTFGQAAARKVETGLEYRRQGTVFRVPEAI